MENFNAKDFIEEKLKEIENGVGDDHVILAISGGVDSTVCGVLASKVLGDKLKVIFIDDGLMREKEPEKVAEDLAGLGIKTEVIDRKNEFFSALKGIEDPEEKRKAFRDTFYRVFGEEVRKSGAKFLMQGTIKADIDETKGGVKTQHNVLEQIGVDPGGYGLKILEPLREIYKHQVREVGKELGLPEHLHQRMPFPGPGLATRVIGEVSPERVEILRKATQIVEEEILEKGSLKPFQCLAVLMKDRATGLRDGQRAFGDIIVIRSVESKDALEAEVTQLPWGILEEIQKRITKEIPSVRKVLFDITPKPPSTIEYI